MPEGDPGHFIDIAVQQADKKHEVNEGQVGIKDPGRVVAFAIADEDDHEQGIKQREAGMQHGEVNGTT